MFESGVTKGAALAAVLEAAPPGCELAVMLDGIEPADLGDAAVIEAVAAWERQMAWGSGTSG